MRIVSLAASCAALLLATACGGGEGTTGSYGDNATADPSASASEHGDGDHAHDDVPGGEHAHHDAQDGPSTAAAMICSDETAEAVQRSFDLGALPARDDTWAAPDYSCRYELADSRLFLTVHDLSPAQDGRAHFTETRRSVRATRIGGLENFGFPAFETRAGVVGFLKDGKTLVVDARRVARRDLPRGFSRGEAAYSVAAAVIGCWTE